MSPRFITMKEPRRNRLAKATESEERMNQDAGGHSDPFMTEMADELAGQQVLGQVAHQQVPKRQVSAPEVSLDQI